MTGRIGGLWTVVWVLLLSATAPAAEEVTVFAAGSLTRSLTEAAKLYETQNGVKVKLNFASAGVLARQISAGAPAGVFISAADKWAVDLKKQGYLTTDKVVLKNEVVLVCRKETPDIKIEFKPEFHFAAAFTGKLVVGEPETTPLGKYAREAFTKLGWWDGLKPRLVLAKDVMETMHVVEHGGAEIGIVFRTDALASKEVKVIAPLPAQLHSPVNYVAGTVKGSDAAARKFFDFLFTEEARKIFVTYGFQIPHDDKPSGKISEGAKPAEK